MQANDRREKEKADAKNALEEYIYFMREKLSGDFAKFIKKDVSFFFLFLCNVWLFVSSRVHPVPRFLAFVAALGRGGKNGDADPGWDWNITLLQEYAFPSVLNMIF